MPPDGPNQLWVADITYVAILTGSSTLRWSSMSGRKGRRLRDRSFDRCQADTRRAALSHQPTPTATRLRASFGRAPNTRPVDVGYGIGPSGHFG